MKFPSVVYVMYMMRSNLSDSSDDYIYTQTVLGLEIRWIENLTLYLGVHRMLHVLHVAAAVKGCENCHSVVYADLHYYNGPTIDPNQHHHLRNYVPYDLRKMLLACALLWNFTDHSIPTIFASSFHRKHDQ